MRTDIGYVKCVKVFPIKEYATSKGLMYKRKILVEGSGDRLSIFISSKDRDSLEVK